MSERDFITEQHWTLITVSFNSASTLERCWRGVDLSTFRWIVVDNASTDHSREVALDLGAEVIALAENVGFSRANNIALAATSSKYVAFVNPDVVVRPGDLSELGHLSSAYDALVAPQLINLDGSLQPNGRGLPFLVDKFAHRGISLPSSDLGRYLPTLSEPSYVAWLIGAVIAGETDQFRALGGWDERYFLYHEDSSLCLSAWNQDMKVILSTNHSWVHEWRRESKSLNWRAIRHEVVSALKFYRIHPELLVPRFGKLTQGLQRARGLAGTSIKLDQEGARHAGSS